MTTTPDSAASNSAAPGSASPASSEVDNGQPTALSVSGTASWMPLAVMGLVIVAWGAGPPITKLITAPPLVGVLFRFGMSFPVLFGIVYARGGRVSRSLLRSTALPGISFGINLIFVFATLQEVTVAVLATAVAIQPALLLIVAGPIFGEKPTLNHVLWSMVGISGAGIVVLGAGDEVRASALGVMLALISVITFSIYFVLTRLARSTTDVDPIEWMAGINLWAFLAAVPPSLFLVGRDDFAQFGGIDWLWMVLLAYLTGVLGHVAMSWVHGYIEAARSSLYLLAMNLVAVGLAWPIHDEPITLIQVLGGAVLLWAVTSVIRLPKADQPAEVA